MPDIQMRFNKDMLVLGGSARNTLVRQGLDAEADMAYLTLMEPESLHDALRVELVAGAQCLVAETKDFIPSRLAHHRMRNEGAKLAAASMALMADLKPQHLLIEIGPNGLPLDPSSKGSLNENRSQYAQAARYYAQQEFDAFFLNGFTSLDDLRCALMGVFPVSEKPVFASVVLDEDGCVGAERRSVAEACALMQEFDAAVVGFQTSAAPEPASELAKQAVGACDVPVLVQLEVREVAPRQFEPTEENPYPVADAMTSAAVKLYGAGVQFLRAVGKATPAYTGVLAATVSGLDVVGFSRSAV